MAYRKKSARARSAYSSRSTYRPKARKATRSRSPQTVKLVIEHVQASPVARPETFGLIQKPAGPKAKF